MNKTALEALRAGATLVTANQRLARHLAAEYGAHCRASGARAWETPDILPWSQWLERFWQECFGLLDGERPRPLLSSFQELTLWERVIREADTAPLLQVPAAARAARDAWQLLHAYRLPLSRAGEFANDDATAFGQWARAYRRYCEQGDHLDSARLADAVTQALAQGRLRRPGQLLLAGFDEFTPQQEALLDVLRSAGSRVEALSGTPIEARVARVACLDARAELRAAAAWVRVRLASGAQRIGVVVPDLQARRSALMREFDEVLLPQALIPGEAVVRPYNLSLGEPLARVPVIQAAFTVLEAGHGRMPFALASTLVRSPFLAGSRDEAAVRAQFDARLRQNGEESLSAHGLMREAQAALTSSHAAAPRLAAQLRAWRDTLPSQAQRLAPSGWSELFARLLALIGWPGEAALDHERVRAIETWRDLLADLSAQDPLAARLSYGETLALLRRMALERVFQPPSPAAPVQVLGLMEAAGLEFDCLWVLGLDDETWPASPRPNPFLPLALQRQHGMPHASAERELEFARRLTERLAHSAAEVIFSHAQTAGDEQRRASPLLLSLPLLRASDLPPPDPGIAARQFAAQEIERVRDQQGPELPPGSVVTGGTALLQQQAACPFRAFAQLRLGARAPEEPEPGLDARVRGQLLHEALRHLWEALESHERLCALPGSELLASIDVAIARALDHAAHERAHTLSGRFRAIEAQRLASLLRQWLELEKQRAPFRLLAAESEQTIELGGLTLNARMDRIDQLDAGGCAIMDYKSGLTSPKKWEGERPDEPQLPAYAIAWQNPQPVTALLFAQLRPGDLAIKGLAAHEGVAPGADSADAGWPAQLDAWRATLTQLAESFRRGDARVDPKEFPKTCEHCGLEALCRVHEQGIAPRGDEEGGDD
jgi:probable DNA repair protein